MNDKQRQKIGQFVETYAKKGPVHVTLIETPFDLPKDWIQIIIIDRVGFTITAGIDTGGNAHT